MITSVLVKQAIEAAIVSGMDREEQREQGVFKVRGNL